MGRDFIYTITYPGDDSYSYENSHHIRLHGSQWDGPSGDKGFTKDEMIDSLRDYVMNMDMYIENVRFTLKVYGRIISKMEDEDEDVVVYIRYE